MTALALSMIVRDAAYLLPACLASARPVVDEMFIADTGSTDDTIEIARGFGATVFSIPWTNDFAAARNRALSPVQTDWVLSLDADEQLDARAPAQVRPLLERRDVGGFLVEIRNYVLRREERLWDRAAEPNDGLLPSAQTYPAFIRHENVRLFRRAPDVYFVGRVHESVGPRLEELHRKLVAATFCIHHFGLAADAETRARKNEFYRDLGRRKIRDLPNNAQAQLELGLVELDNFNNLEAALALFERACALQPRFGVAWFFAGLTLVKLQRFAAALPALSAAEKCGHATALVAETRGDALYNLGQFSEACRSYRAALRRDAHNPSLESKLGLAEVRAGKPAQGLARIKRALTQPHALPELYSRLIHALVFLNRLADAAAAAEQRLGLTDHPAAADFLRAACLWAEAGQSGRATEALETGLRLCPDDPKLQQAVAELRPNSARPKLQVV